MTEEELYYRLYLLLLEQMGKSDSPDVASRLEAIRRGLISDASPGVQHRLLIGLSLSLCMCDDWKICQVVTFLMLHRDQEKTWTPEARWGKIKYDFEDFLYRREVCLRALELYREICQKRQIEVEREPSACIKPPPADAPSCDELIDSLLERMMYPGFSMSDQEKLDLNNAFDRDYGELERSLETPDVYLHDLTEPERIHFNDLAPKLLGHLELEQLVTSGNHRLDRVITQLRQLNQP